MAFRVLIVDDCIELREALVYALKGYFDEIEVKQAGSHLAAVEILEEDRGFSLVLCDYDLPDGDGRDLYLWMKSQALHEKFVLLSKVAPQDIVGFDNENIRYVTKPNVFNPLIELVKRSLQEQEAKESQKPINSSLETDYFAVEVEQIEKLKLFHVDLYVRLSESKYVKMIKAGVGDYDQRLHELQEKDIEIVYIKHSEAADVINHRVLEVSLAKELENEQNFKTNQLAINESILKSIRTMGVTKEVVQLVQSTVDASHERVQSVGALSELINGFSSEDYITSHSTVLAHVGGFLVSKLSWSQEGDYEKIALAALLHDVSVADDKIARVQTREHMHYLIGEYSMQEFEEYKHHPVMASDVTQFFTESDFPTEVEVMIHQHHERPDGSGFPNGLSHNGITLEAAVFIIAHEIVELMSKQWVNVSFPFLIKYLQKHLSGGPFDTVLEELSRNHAQ